MSDHRKVYICTKCSSKLTDLQAKFNQCEKCMLMKKLKCAYCKKYFPENKIWIAKDGKNHCCFNCY